MTKAVISTSSPLPDDAAKNPHGHVARPPISESQLSPAGRCRFCPFTRFRLGRPDQPSRRRRLLAREPCRGRCAHTRIPAPALCRAPPSRPVPAAACTAVRRDAREARQGAAPRVPVSSALLRAHANRRYPCPRLVGPSRPAYLTRPAPHEQAGRPRVEGAGPAQRNGWRGPEEPGPARVDARAHAARERGRKGALACMLVPCPARERASEGARERGRGRGGERGGGWGGGCTGVFLVVEQQARLQFEEAPRPPPKHPACDPPPPFHQALASFDTAPRRRIRRVPPPPTRLRRKRRVGSTGRRIGGQHRKDRWAAQGGGFFAPRPPLLGAFVATTFFVEVAGDGGRRRRLHALQRLQQPACRGGGGRTNDRQNTWPTL